MRKNAQHRRLWQRWLIGHDVARGDIAFILDIDPELLEADLVRPFQQPAAAAWPLTEPNADAARRRRLIGDTANKIRRMAELRYSPPRIAELLHLELAAVRSFLRRIRRRRSVRSDRAKPGELIRPRTEAEETAARRAADRARKRRDRRAAKTPPPEWSWKARAASARADVAALVALQAAVREGRLSAAAVLDLAAVLYFAEPRAALPEPVIWVGRETFDRGQPKLDTQQVAEIFALRREGWSTGKLSRRFNVTRATICNVLLRRCSYPPPCPAPPIVLPCSGDKSRISAAKQGTVAAAAWVPECSDHYSDG